MLPFGSHSTPPVQRFAAEIGMAAVVQRDLHDRGAFLIREPPPLGTYSSHIRALRWS